MASLVPYESPLQGKRRLSAAVDQDELIKPEHKRLRSDELDAPLVQEEHSTTNGNSSKLSDTDSQSVNGYHRDPLVITELDSLQTENAALGTETSGCEDVPAPVLCSAPAEPQQSSSQMLSTTDVELICSPNECTSPASGIFKPSQAQSRCSAQGPDQASHANSKATTAALQLTQKTGSLSQESACISIPPRLDAHCAESSANQSSFITAMQSAAFAPFPDKLFWSNSNNLCWLDSMLVALVNCQGLRKRRPQDQPQKSSVWQLIQEYEAVCAALHVHQQPGRG